MLKKLFSDHTLSGILITDIITIRYLTGFTGTTALLIATARRLFLITDFRYLEQAKKQAPDCVILNSKDGLAKLIEKSLGTRTKKAPARMTQSDGRLGFFAHDTTVALWQRLKKQLAKITLVPLSEDSALLRIIKKPAEIELLKEALLINRHAFKKLLPEIKPGRTEFEIRRRLETLLLTYGAERIGFDTIIASGVRGALPHGVATAKIIKRGELITIDFGGVYHGYHADETITIALGSVSAKQTTIYQIVYDAQRFAFEAVKPGVSAAAIDAVARNYIDTKGYGKFFGHALGHGVGLAVHERPVLGPTSTDTLEVGSVFTIEPGIYIPKWGGVRLEDVVLLGKNGPELISKIKKNNLIAL